MLESGSTASFPPTRNVSIGAKVADRIASSRLEIFWEALRGYVLLVPTLLDDEDEVDTVVDAALLAVAITTETRAKAHIFMSILCAASSAL